MACRGSGHIKVNAHGTVDADWGFWAWLVVVSSVELRGRQGASRGQRKHSASIAGRGSRKRPSIKQPGSEM